MKSKVSGYTFVGISLALRGTIDIVYWRTLSLSLSVSVSVLGLLDAVCTCRASASAFVHVANIK